MSLGTSNSATRGTIKEDSAFKVALGEIEMGRHG